MKKVTRLQLIIVSLVIITALIAILIWAMNSRFKGIDEKIVILSNKVSVLEGNLSSTTAQLRGDIDKSQISLSDTLNQQKQKLDDYRQQVGTVSSTVTTLQKLSKTDPQLLQKYSKVFFLNENYAPARLVAIPDQYKYSDTKDLKLNSQVWPYLQKMLDNAALSNIPIYVSSAYRSFSEQTSLKGQYTVTYGAGSANQFSADQGYSEHQLGTTVDLITSGIGGNIDNFDGTKAYNWLSNNAYRFGFILSYPKDNKFYVYEPWHWRFVGVKLATDLHTKAKNFYDLDQRDIDEYLVSLFD